ncbi:MAG: CvpA family protein [Dehalococcoidia bacterium]
MHWLDIVIIVVAALVGLSGLRNGLIRMAFGLGGLIGGIVLAGRFYGGLAALLAPDEAIWAKILAYIIILVATIVVAGVAGWFISRLVHLAMLGWLDRIGGLVVGVFIGGMLCAAVLVVLGVYSPAVRAAINASAMASFVVGGLPLLLALLPEEFDFRPIVLTT